jgi:hypothetical protein
MFILNIDYVIVRFKTTLILYFKLRGKDKAFLRKTMLGEMWMTENAEGVGSLATLHKLLLEGNALAQRVFALL